MIHGLKLAGTAEGAISANRFVKYGSTDGGILQAAANSDLIVGASDTFDIASGERIDVQHGGVADIKFGGAITRGQKVTSDANGQAVVATSTGTQVAGIALVSGISGDIGGVLLSPSVL